MLTIINIIWSKKGLMLFLIIILSCIITIYYQNNDHQNISDKEVSKDKVKIVIDPGHGSIDTGTSYNGIKEKEINLEMAKFLKKEFENTNLKPIMTRTEDKLYQDDRNQDIKYRPRVAQKNNADILISLHANNFTSSEPSGAQIFYKPGSEESKKLAEYIKKELINLRKANNRPVFEGRYYILQNVDIPAVLIESGFLSNPEDRKLLTNPEYQKKFIKQVKKGLINYLKTNNKK